MASPTDPTRAALERLRNFLWCRTGGDPAEIRHVVSAEIDNELAALASAPEPAEQAASPGLVEAVQRLAQVFYSTTQFGMALPVASAIEDVVAAERARKPDDRDATIAELTKRAEEAEALASRRWQDRYDALSAVTTEGLSAAEWQMRTGTAERERREALATIAELRGKLESYEMHSEANGRAICSLQQRLEQAEAALADANAELLKAGIAASAYESTADAVRQLRECMEAAQKLTREAEKKVAAARQEGLRELRGKIPTSMVYSGYPFVYVSEVEKLIDRLLADPAPPAAEPDKFDPYAAREALKEAKRFTKDGIHGSSLALEALTLAVEECVDELARRGGGR